MEPSVPRIVHAPESSRWYSADGHSVLEVQGASGKPVKPDIRHARKLGLVPSVTTIIGQLARPGLEAWKGEQLILASLTLPHPVEESLEAFAKRVIEDAREQGQRAAEDGKVLHAEIQHLLIGDLRPDVYSVASLRCVDAIRLWQEQHGMQDIDFHAEHGFCYSADAWRFGGSPDLWSPELICDIKTTDLAKWKKAGSKPWPEWQVQIAAYLRARPSKLAYQIIVDRTTGETVMRKWSETELENGWEQFDLLRRLWYLRNDLKWEEG